VLVNAGEGTSANFDDVANVVTVTGRAMRIDVKSPESSMVLSEAAIDRIPVARDVTAVALLAPGAVRGDSRIGQTSLLSNKSKPVAIAPSMAVHWAACSVSPPSAAPMNGRAAPT
jgi:hypothetical protein